MNIPRLVFFILSLQLIISCTPIEIKDGFTFTNETQIAANETEISQNQQEVQEILPNESESEQQEPTITQQQSQTYESYSYSGQNSFSNETATISSSANVSYTANVANNTSPSSNFSANFTINASINLTINASINFSINASNFKINLTYEILESSCGIDNCINEMFYPNCTPAYQIVRLMDVVIMKTEILGLTEEGKCRVKIIYLEHPNPELIDADLICSFDPSKELAYQIGEDCTGRQTEIDMFP